MTRPPGGQRSFCFEFRSSHDGFEAHIMLEHDTALSLARRSTKPPESAPGRRRSGAVLLAADDTVEPDTRLWHRRCSSTWTKRVCMVGRGGVVVSSDISVGG